MKFRRQRGNKKKHTHTPRRERDKLDNKMALEFRSSCSIRLKSPDLVWLTAWEEEEEEIVNDWSRARKENLFWVVKRRKGRKRNRTTSSSPFTAQSRSTFSISFLPFFTFPSQTLLLKQEPLMDDAQNEGRKEGRNRSEKMIFIITTGPQECFFITDFFSPPTFSRCDGKRSCQMPINSHIFEGDPCVGTRKYIEVHYNCESEDADSDSASGSATSRKPPPWLNVNGVPDLWKEDRDNNGNEVHSGGAAHHNNNHHHHHHHQLPPPARKPILVQPTSLTTTTPLRIPITTPRVYPTSPTTTTTTTSTTTSPATVGGVMTTGRGGEFR